MEDFLKDFEFYGFISEFHMMLTITNEYSDSVKYGEEFRQKPIKELIEHWIDNHSENWGMGQNGTTGESGRTTPSPVKN